MSSRASVRFLRHVEVHGFDHSVCWEWRGATKGNGYGNFRFGRRTVPAHRAAYQILVGEVPDGMDVCHTCDNRICVNPDHLFLGTRRANMEDARHKGRISRGEKHAHAIRTGVSIPGAKLSADQVREIWQRLKGGHNPSQIAGNYSITPGAINAIRRGATWRHITGAS